MGGWLGGWVITRWVDGWIHKKKKNSEMISAESKL